VMTHASIDLFLVIIVLVAKLWSWDSAGSGSVIILDGQLKAVCTVDAIVFTSWVVRVATAGSTCVVALAAFDGIIVRILVLIAGLHSWHLAVPGSIIILWVKFEAICTGDALRIRSWMEVIPTSSATFMAGAVVDCVAVNHRIARSFDFFDASKQQSDNKGWCFHL
jgi:hypothetical protein